MLYNIRYEYAGQTRTYCMANMDLATAKVQLEEFKARYIGPDGKGRPDPNGKGVYPISSPRIVQV